MIQLIYQEDDKVILDTLDNIEQAWVVLEEKQILEDYIMIEGNIVALGGIIC